jgi:translocation and assembly module TamB
MQPAKKKHWVKRIFKWIGIALGIIVVLLIALWFVLKTSWAQNIIRKEIVSYLQKKFQTKVAIGKIDINYLYHLEIDRIYLEDKQKLPLAYIGKLQASYRLLDLLDNQLTLSSVAIDSLKLNIYNTPTDSLFNYDFITRAFAGTEDPKKVEDTTTSGTEFRFDLKEIILSRADLVYHDLYSGQQFDIDFKKIDLELTEFNPASLVFSLDHLFTENLHARISFTKAGGKDDTDETENSIGPMPLIKADTILLAGTHLVYSDTPSQMGLTTIAAKLGLSNLVLDLNKNDAKLKSLVLTDHSTRFAMRSEKEDAQKDTLTADPGSKPFTFSVASLYLDKNSVQYDDNKTRYTKSTTMDFGHLLLNDLHADITGISYDGKDYRANIHSLSTREQSGFQLKKLTATAFYGEQKISLDNAVLHTNNSIINADLEAGYASLEQLSQNMGNTAVQANFSNTKLNLNDLLYFQAGLAKNEYIQPLLSKDIFLNTKLKGKLRDLTISQLQIREGNILLNATAHITGLPDADKMKIDLMLHQFSGTREGLLALLPKDLIPSSIHIPDRFTVKGTYNGTMDNMNADIQLLSSSGNLSIKGNASNIKDSLNAVYSADIKTEELSLGSLLGDTSLGVATVNIKVKGKGYAVKTANIEMEGDIAKLQAKGYTYTDMKIKGKLADNKLVATLNSSDPNLLANIDLAYDMDPDKPSLALNSDEIFVDLQKLGLYQDPLRIKTKLNVDLQNADPDRLQGTVVLSALQVGFQDKIFPIDSIKLTARQIGDSNSIDLETPVLTANLKGLYKITTLAESVQGIIAHYVSDTAITKPLPPNEALLTGTFKNHDIIRSFVPELRQISDMPLYLYLNSEDYRIKASAATRVIRYDNYILDSLQLNIDTKNDSLLYDLRLKQLRNPSVPLHRTYVYGAIKNGDLGWNIRLLDRKNLDAYGLSGTYATDSSGVSELKLKPLLLLNKQIWSANEDNMVRFNKDGLAGGNLELKYRDNALEIKSGSQGGMPVDVNFKKFSIQTLANLVQSDTMVADGFINGTVHLASANPLSVSADLTVDSIQVYQQPVGTLKLLAKNTSADVFNIDAKLSGDHLNMSVTGNYTNQGDGGLDFVVDMPEVGLKSVQPFLKDIVTNMGGAVSGRMTLQGTVAKPAVRGNLDFKNASLTYLDYSTYVKIPDERIEFNEQGILFRDFTIQDSLGNPITINGNIATSDYQKFQFGLALDATNFLAINKRLSPDQLIYGPASIDARLTLKGDLDLPVIEGQVRVRDKSMVTVVIPSEDPEVETRRGIIRFVDKDVKIDSSMLAGKKDTAETQITGLSVSINAEITPESSLTIVLDEQNGDSLQVRGNANLNITMDPSGKTSLTGRYTVSEGSYVLSLSQFIKRKFNIQKDGTITWSGDPTAATLDLSAIYNVNTAPEQLLQDQTATQGERLRQKLPFEVILNIKGEMLKPAISFKLDMPEREQNALDGVVYTRIKQINNDESELNKQVMGLLVLNNFISDNPFSSLQQGTSPEMLARRTAGKILSQQLNNLVGNVIKGVDINFDLESQEDYSTGSLENQTNLNVGVSKQLFNERTTVSVGSSVPIEGSRQTSAPLVGNVTVEYKLTRDGRYRIKVYRRTDNTAFLQGEVVETGVGFTLVMDYNEFKEILRKSRRDKRLEKETKKQKKNK